MPDKIKLNETTQPVHYDPMAFESKWQKFWKERRIYRAADFSEKPKYYCLVEFPYPSGAGLHVGHVRSYASMDAFVRYKRMQGFNVLYPMGWDAFGLPAENYAIKVGIHPSKTVAENILHFRAQSQALGLSFDWGREINTTDPSYYRWTQWIFLKLFEAGLAYRTEVSVNWCAKCRTNLADEEVLANETHERCGSVTEKRLQRQWLLRITNYAQRLLDDLNLVDFSQKIRVQQENWIGRKEGIIIRFSVLGSQSSDKSLPVVSQSVSETDKRKTSQQLAENRKPKTDNRVQITDDLVIEAFTTRPDTMFGATFIVLAPEHPFVTKIVNGEVEVDEKTSREIKQYLASAKKKTELERISEGRKKTGISTGHFALNSPNGKLLPIWISDFVLASFGTGAVVGVPGHDLRDFEFARQFGLPVVRVVVGADGDTSEIIESSQIQEREGKLVNSKFLDGLEVAAAIEKMISYLEVEGYGKRVVTYHLRDWVFSRQHYWGEPIPLVYCQNVGAHKDREGLMRTLEDGVEHIIVPLPEAQLPLTLPYVERYQPSGTGQSPLSSFPDWVKTTCPVCGGPAKRETDTMPNWAGSNWYYLAYLFSDKLGNYKSEIPSTKQIQNSNFDNVFTSNKSVIDHWMPVDLYEGGFEHTTLHLLYSRFIYKFLFDLGLVPGPEPYLSRRSHGIVLGPDGRKMSKSFGNVINPDETVKQYGSDTLRIYEMFMGPFEQSVSWSDSNLQGCYRFLSRVYRLTLKNIRLDDSPAELKAVLHTLIKKVGDDLSSLKFNTAVAALMEFINAWENNYLSYTDGEAFLTVLSPLAPHLTEELWQLLRVTLKRSEVSVHQLAWPNYDSKLIQRQTFSVVIQVNGRLRDHLEVAVGTDEKTIIAYAKDSPKVGKYLTNEPLKTIYVPGKLVNFVI